MGQWPVRFARRRADRARRRGQSLRAGGPVPLVPAAAACRCWPSITGLHVLNTGAAAAPTTWTCRASCPRRCSTATRPSPASGTPSTSNAGTLLAEHLRRGRDRRQQRAPPGGAPAGARLPGQRPRARRRHRGDRGRGRRLVRPRRAVAARLRAPRRAWTSSSSAASSRPPEPIQQAGQAAAGGRRITRAHGGYDRTEW